MEKKTLTYKVWDNTCGVGYNGLSGFVAPAASFVKGRSNYEGMWVYYRKSYDDDSTVYRTFLQPGEALDPDYYWVEFELKVNGERALTPAQLRYSYDSLANHFCNYKAFMEAYNGLHDEVNTYGKVEPVSPDVPQ